MTVYLKDECLNHVRGGLDSGVAGIFSNNPEQFNQTLDTLWGKGPSITDNGLPTSASLPAMTFYDVAVQTYVGTPQAIPSSLSNIQIVK